LSINNDIDLQQRGISMLNKVLLPFAAIIAVIVLYFLAWPVPVEPVAWNPFRWLNID